MIYDEQLSVFFRQTDFDVDVGKLLVHLPRLEPALFNDCGGRASKLEEFSSLLRPQLHSSLKPQQWLTYWRTTSGKIPADFNDLIDFIQAEGNFEKNPRSRFCLGLFSRGQLLVLRTGKFHLPRWVHVISTPFFLTRPDEKFATFDRYRATIDGWWKHPLDHAPWRSSSMVFSHLGNATGKKIWILDEFRCVGVKKTPICYQIQ